MRAVQYALVLFVQAALVCSLLCGVVVGIRSAPSGAGSVRELLASELSR